MGAQASGLLQTNLCRSIVGEQPIHTCHSVSGVLEKASIVVLNCEAHCGLVSYLFNDVLCTVLFF